MKNRTQFQGPKWKLNQRITPQKFELLSYKPDGGRKRSATIDCNGAAQANTDNLTEKVMQAQILSY